MAADLRRRTDGGDMGRRPVAVLTSIAAAAGAAVVVSIGLGVPERSSVVDLEGIRDDVWQLPVPAADRQSVHTASIDAAHNRVIVGVAWVTPTLRRAVSERYGESVTLEVTPVPDRLVRRSSAPVRFPYADQARSAESRYGDRAPYLGGARILIREGGTNRYTVCTSGIPVRSRAGTEYMLTAGHCAPSGAGRRTAATGYLSPGQSGAEVTVVARMGPVTASTYVRGSKSPLDDLALIQADTANALWHGDSRHPIQSRRLSGERAAEPGTKVCHGGASSGRSCTWRVERTGVTVRYSEGGGRYTYVHGLVMARRLGSAVLREGDSGGPVYAWTPSGRVYAYGVVSGGAGNDWLLFTPIGRAVDRWDLQAP